MGFPIAIRSSVWDIGIGVKGFDSKAYSDNAALLMLLCLQLDDENWGLALIIHQFTKVKSLAMDQLLDLLKISANKQLASECSVPVPLRSGIKMYTCMYAHAHVHPQEDGQWRLSENRNLWDIVSWKDGIMQKKEEDTLDAELNSIVQHLCGCGQVA